MSWNNTRMPPITIHVAEENLPSCWTLEAQLQGLWSCLFVYILFSAFFLAAFLLSAFNFLREILERANTSLVKRQYPKLYGADEDIRVSYENFP